MGKLQIGTELAVAELALRRLKEEAENLSKRREAMLNGRIDRKKWGYVIGVALQAKIDVINGRIEDHSYQAKPS